MKIIAKISIILGAVGAVLLTILAILKEVMGGRLQKEHLEQMKEGFKDASKANAEVIKESLAISEIQRKIINKKVEEVKSMSMGEQAEIAKKLGL